jgi:DNA-binding NtrC family response regulator
MNTKLEDIKSEAGIIGQSEAINSVIERAVKIAATNSHILIMGEVGTEKQQFAKFIHLLSKRKSNEMSIIDCSQPGKYPIEIQLFGHEKDIVKGAQSYSRLGCFERADTGSVFIESAGQLSLDNMKLIKKAMIDGSIQRIGRDMVEKIDTRVFLDIELDTRGKPVLPSLKKQFANMNVAEIVIPPLRERREDIPLYFSKQLSPGAYERLNNYDWPGNVKQLRTSLGMFHHRADTLHAEDFILSPPGHFLDLYTALPEPEQGFKMSEFLTNVEKQLMLRAINNAELNLSEAARMLGVSAKTVRKFWEKFEAD